MPQEMQSNDPTPGWYVPAEHLVQLPCAACSLNVPVLHAVSTVLPMLQYLPAAHSAHPDCDDSPAAPLNRPAGHSVTALDPCRQKPPAVHVTHTDAPVPVWKRPAAHAVHAPCPC